MHSRVASTGSNFIGRNPDAVMGEPTCATLPLLSHLDFQIDQTSNVTAAAGPSNAACSTNLTTSSESDKNGNTYPFAGSPQHSEAPTQSDRSWLPGLGRVPMLAQLLDEVDTARFYAYCEEVCCCCIFSLTNAMLFRLIRIFAIV